MNKGFLSRWEQLAHTQNRTEVENKELKKLNDFLIEVTEVVDKGIDKNQWKEVTKKVYQFEYENKYL